VTSRT